MSGVEILGLAASVIQIAELGAKLSIKLYTLTRKVKDANKNIEALSQEIAVTGNLLQELGHTLSQQDNLRVCSQQAIDTARTLVTDTQDVFRKLTKVVDSEDASHKSKLRSGIGLKQRLRFVTLESEIEQVKANLERLKSSLLVILNVLIFAEQLRSQEVPAILNDQRDLIKSLVAEKQENEKRYDAIMKAIEGKPSDSFSIASSTTLVVDPNLDLVGTDSHKHRPPVSPALRQHQVRILEHSHLVQRLLDDIDDASYKVDHGSRGRLQDSVLNAHWNEWAAQRQRAGVPAFESLLEENQAIAQFWRDRYLEETQGQAGESRLDSPPAPKRLLSNKAEQIAVAPISLQPKSSVPEVSRRAELYNFDDNSDSEDSIDLDVAELTAASRRLRLYAQTMGKEVDAQNSAIDRIMMKSDRLDDCVVLNRERLQRITSDTRLEARPSSDTSQYAFKDKVTAEDPSDRADTKHLHSSHGNRASSNLSAEDRIVSRPVILEGGSTSYESTLLSCTADLDVDQCTDNIQLTSGLEPDEASSEVVLLPAKLESTDSRYPSERDIDDFILRFTTLTADELTRSQ